MMSREELDAALVHYLNNITVLQTYQRWTTAPQEMPRRRDLLRIYACVDIPLGEFMEHILGFPGNILTLDLGNKIVF